LKGPACCLLRVAVAIDNQAFEDALDVVAGLAEGNALDPVDGIDRRVARVAVEANPTFRAVRSGVVGGQRQDIGAVELVEKLAEISLAKPDVVVRIVSQAAPASAA
jgi:hypothetical protein